MRIETTTALASTIDLQARPFLRFAAAGLALLFLVSTVPVTAASHTQDATTVADPAVGVAETKRFRMNLFRKGDFVSQSTR